MHQEAAEEAGPVLNGAAGPGSADLQSAVQELEARVAELQALRAYRDEFVVLENIRVTQRQLYGYPEPQRAVRGRLRNLGDQTLNKV